MYKKGIKTFFDISVAVILLILFSPIFITLTLLLALTLKGDPFFYQKRPGKNEAIFSIIKFRTMNNKKNKEGLLLPDAKRVTCFGKFIRSTSLDEIPQLFNVLLGNMSIIGPRPLLPEYLNLYSDSQRQRHFVKPGITGYAQVNGRNAITWKKKLELDVYYVKNFNFALDFKILLKTIQKVFLREDITDFKNITVERFNGNN